MFTFMEDSNVDNRLSICGKSFFKICGLPRNNTTVLINKVVAVYIL